MITQKIKAEIQRRIKSLYNGREYNELPLEQQICVNMLQDLFKYIETEEINYDKLMGYTKM